MIGDSTTVPPAVVSSRWRRRRTAIVLLIAAMSGSMIALWPFGGTPSRPRWTTSHVHGRPEGVAPFRLEEIPGLLFHEPVDHVLLPGRRESLVLETKGRLLKLSNEGGAWQSSEIVDLGKPAFSLLPAQDFASSGELFVTLAEPSAKNEQSIVRVCRLRLDPATLACVDGVGTVVVEWLTQSLDGHMGGALAFDASGCLIIGTGDGGNSNGVGAAYEVGQNMLDLRAKVLRVDPRIRDVSPSPAPADNPFISDPNVRSEIFAAGMRNPWKFTVHPSTREIYAFNVGEDLWETVYHVAAGTNAGWPLYEGTHPFRPGASDGRRQADFAKPVIELSHAECRAIVGGLFYFGRQFESLQGHLIFGDYTSGAVFAAQLGETPRVLARSGQPILEISADHDGELLFFSQSGRVFQLASRQFTSDQPFPHRLSETGLFANTTEYRLSPGIVDYDVNAPLYSDGTAKRRHIALPGNSRITFSVNHPWGFPEGTVIVKTFLAEVEPTHRLLETRLMHFENGQWSAYSYRWNDDQSDADLVPDTGDEIPFHPAHGSETTWRIPSRTQCMMCHTMGASFVLGVNTPQLNRNVESPNGIVNQLEYFENLGLFGGKLPRKHHLRGLLTSSAVDTFPRLTPPELESAPVHDRAIAYLYSNCAHCHRYLGGGNSRFSLDWKLDAADYGLIDERPVHGFLDLENPCLVAPGAPHRSILLERMRRRDAAHMPKIGTSRNDEEGIELIRRWIEAMPTLNSGT